MMLTLQTADLPVSFPDYVDPLEPYRGVDTMATRGTPGNVNKPIDKVRDEVDRHPSPQPSHLSSTLLSRPNGNGHRILRSATVGYVAPEFKGKSQQMKEGECVPFSPSESARPHCRMLNPLSSQGGHRPGWLDP